MRLSASGLHLLCQSIHGQTCELHVLIHRKTLQTAVFCAKSSAIRLYLRR